MDNTLQKNAVLEGKYTVLFFNKKNKNSETYRVKGTDGKLYFLKLFSVGNLHHTAFDKSGNLLEIEFFKRCNHPNIAAYKDSGEMIVENKKFLYLVLDFIAGETLAEKMLREKITTFYDIRQIISGVLNGLNYLHTLPEPIIHNEITSQNIMLDLSGETPQAKIIDLGYARSFLELSKTYNREGLDLNFVASECLTAGTFSPQSDLFSVGALIYQMLFGIPPWNRDISAYQTTHSNPAELVLTAREKPLTIPNVVNRIADFSEDIIKIIVKALLPDISKRFQSAQEFLQALNGEEIKDIEIRNSETSKGTKTNSTQQKKKGKGFADIVGMQQLKDQLKNEVIDLINDPEGAKMYNISMPNGMLLYGPPGCGKTFFAEKFAEETRFNYKYVNPSELGSIYIHGTQEKIGNLFNEARKNAPFIICLDEVSSLFPKRDSAREHQVGEVDEFLTQINNCGQDGVFVIATTNFPQNIDEALLRAGRLGIKIYVSPPDYEARKGLFELYVNKIPNDYFGINFDELAKLTENYVTSDIRAIVETVAYECRKNRTRVTMEMLTDKIKTFKPTVTIELIKKHENIKKIMEEGKSAAEGNPGRIVIGGFQPPANKT